MVMRFVWAYFAFATSLQAADCVPRPTVYRSKIVPSRHVDRRWPSINNQGEYAWAEQVGGMWEIHTSRNRVPNCPGCVPTNRRYPVITDDGTVTWEESRPSGRNCEGPHLINESGGGCGGSQCGDLHSTNIGTLFDVSSDGACCVTTSTMISIDDTRNV